VNLDKINNKIKNANGKVVLGIDGIIDQVWEILETRISKDEYRLIKKMKEFGQLIVDRGEGGMANELIQKRRCSGGFTANTGRALGTLGFDTVMMGMYGERNIDKVFVEFEEKCELISLGDPAIGNIFEFEDGKIMMPYLDSLLHFDWAQLLDKLHEEKLKEIFRDANVVSIGYWSNMPDFDNIITKLVTDILEDDTERMFFDFANISKRSSADLEKTLNILGSLNSKIPVTLSLNKHEAALLFDLYNEEFSDEINEILETSIRVREKINLNELVIHTPYYALAVSPSTSGALIQDYCDSPIKTTGAGDTFNAGYIATYLYSLDLIERLAVANATTSFYLKKAIPPTKGELSQELIRIKEKLALMNGGS